MKKALVAMSGGVDSSVAAYLMKNTGYDTTGAIMELYGNSSSIEDARRVADRLGIGLLVYDMKDDFRLDVIGYFIDEYERGRTPNPCVVCNRLLKFGALYSSARVDLREDPVIATGHYAVTRYDPASERYILRKASDPAKDQSYFLYSLSQEQLSRTAFPLGGMTKTEVREIAESQGFVTARKKESQDICFIPDGDYVSFITASRGVEYPHGSFVSADGTVLGEHRGIINYTIGQRKGLGIALGKPAYVCGIDAKHNRVILGNNEDLMAREFTVSRFNWVSMAPQTADFRADVRIRYRHKESPARVIPLAEDKVRIVFDQPQRAITGGQSAVLYDGDLVLGGGIIE